MNATCDECGADCNEAGDFYSLLVEETRDGTEVHRLFCGPVCLATWAARECNYLLIGEGMVIE